MRRVLLLNVVALFVGGPSDAADRVDYTREVKPLLQERCFACHGALKQNGKLRLDSGAAILKGGSSGPAVTAGRVADSLLLDRVSDPDPEGRMPPEGQPLTEAQIRTLRAWVEQGASFPANDAPEPDPREHWSFRVPVKPPIPSAAASGTGGNPVDAFIADGWRRLGLSPVPPADRRLLLRRLYLDLVGLPPTPEETEAFLRDPVADAYERVVDRLLDSPQYGERWGRHWMDVWRYSDWWGLGPDLRNSQKHIWHWRDWIIDSLRTDVGYDEMIRQMLAADELYPSDLERLRATGFLARQYFKFNRTTWLDETVEHTSKAFLGLTMNCTKCHDHKYDPISQTDYYRMRAVFEPYQVRTDMLPGQVDFEKDGIPRAFDCNLNVPTYRHERGDDRRPVKDRLIAPGVPALLATTAFRVEPVRLPDEAFAPHLRTFVEENYVRSAEAKSLAARGALASARNALDEAERLAAREKAQPAPTADAGAGKPVIADRFGKRDDELWAFGPGDWRYDQGTLRQSSKSSERCSIRARRPIPADFEARFAFAITGGEPYRSVGFCFDVGGNNEVLVYASAFAGGPKVQVAYKQGSAHTYPPEALRTRSIKLGDSLELTVRVRGTLINVDVNNEPSITYRLPVPRKPGAFELITYTATATFLKFEVGALSPSVRLRDPKDVRPTLDEARAAVRLAEKAVAAAEAQLPAIRARFAAERARSSVDQSGRQQLAEAAARAEKQASLAQAEESLARAELELAKAPTGKNADAQKKCETARAAVADARRALEKPGTTYAALPGAVKSPESNVEDGASLRRPFPETSTGRRRALANWIADRANPLTARVAVNHVWSRHFGKPLVATVFDFGRKGTKPTHPELLDWLAVDFMEHGWSFKHLHRLIVTSSAYRLGPATAAGTAANRKNDPENRFLWHRQPARMEAQVVRDSLLQLAAQLDTRLGGPPIDPAGQADSRRRSLYFVHSHNDHHKFLMQFDDASVLECYRRTESIVPQQALTLSNSAFALTMAAAIHDRLQKRLGPASDAEYVRSVFQVILAVDPAPEEQQACTDALAEWQRLLKAEKRADPVRKARTNLVNALLNHNDFVTIR